MTIRINDPHAIKIIMNATCVQFVPQLHFCIARYSESDKLMGGTLYTDYWGGSVGCHFAGFAPGWINRELLWLGFDYPFNYLKVKKLFGTIRESNVQSRNVALRLGYKIEYLIEGVFNRPDGVNGMYLMSMLKEDCRWLDMPKPDIKFAPLERTNVLSVLEPVGMMQ